MIQGRVIQGRFGPAGPRAGAAPARGVVQRRGAADVRQLPSHFAAGGAPGRPLPDGVRSRMEEFFRADFSDVRVHVGPEAPSIGALAFTMGSRIYFAPGQYAPDSPQGQALLGHELAHVVQQRAGRVRNPFGAGVAIVQDHHLEAEADRLGQLAANHRPAPRRGAQAGSGRA